MQQQKEKLNDFNLSRQKENIQQIQSKKQQEKKNSQSTSNQNKSNEQKQKKLNEQKIIQSSKQEIKKQLISMQFDINDIQQSLLYCNDLDKAIQFIISKLEVNQKQQNKLTKEVKLFLIARMDLKMGPGKVAAQVGHATLKAFQMMRNSTLYSQQRAKLLVQWLQNGQKIKILKVQTQKELYDLVQKAKNKSINCCYIRDAGRTQIAAGSTTVAAIGPIGQNVADFLSNLKQL